jgi:shikimate dehydrogenase
MTSKYCVVGSPIQHSLSPIIHQAAYSHLGLDFSYGRAEVTQGQLSDFLEGSDLSGVSVTMPLKYEAFGLSGTCSEEATKTGAVNTLVRSSDGWAGHNTDVEGFIRCFTDLSSVTSITLIGSGATARSAALAISSVFPKTEICIMGRNPQAVLNFADLVTGLGLTASVANLEADTVLKSDLVVSTVPGSAFVDLWEQVSLGTPNKEATLFDVAYDPWPSLASRAWGPNSISGLELLIWQAIAQVKLFAEAKGLIFEATDSELYGVMKAAATK